jgi:hypothetical protein
MVFRRCLAAILPTAVGLIAAPAHADELSGVWASDPALCGKIFSKNGNRLAFAPLSDFYGSGFIIEGNRIRGKMATCTIKSRREEGATAHLSATCSTEIAAEDMQFTLKLINDDMIGRLYPGEAAMEVDFHRCKL